MNKDTENSIQQLSRYQLFKTEGNFSDAEFEITAFDIDGHDRLIKRIAEDDQGNVIFTPLDVNSALIPLASNPEKMNSYDRKILTRIRYNDRLAEEKGHRYSSPYGSKSYPWLPNIILNAYQKKRKIDTLCIVEGEFKSESLCKQGIYTIGISGIWNFRDSDTKDFPDGVKKVIQECNVKKIVLLFDADTLGPNKISELNDKGKDLAERHRIFHGAVKCFMAIANQFNLDLYFSFILPEYELTGKGIDDLLYLKRDKNEEVLTEFKKLDSAQKYFKTTLIENNKNINQIFFLGPKGNIDPNKFYANFKDVLTGKNFMLNNVTYFGENGQAVVKHTETIDLLADSKNPDADLESHQYYIKGGRYWTRVYTNKKYHDKMISNFVMKIEYHFIDGTNNTRRLLKLKRYSGEIRTIEVLSSESSRKDAFETILKSHNCTFLGSGYDLAVIFQRLMDFQMEAYAISTMGFQPYHDLYVFSNALIYENQLFFFNNDGIARVNNKSFYSPSCSELNKDNAGYQDERNFEYRQGTIDFKTWTDLIFKAYGINGGIALLFTINALFRDIVYDELNFFPYLFLFGPAGVGKSSFTDIYLKLFGKKETGESLKNSTIKGLARKCAQRNNGIVFFKEYDANLPPATHKFTKDAYDGAGYTRAMTTNDKRTDTILVQSAIFIDGNVLPSSESAVFDRMIILNFEKDSHTADETNAYKELLKKSNDGLGQIVKEILAHRKKFKSEFITVFTGIYEQLKYSKPETSKFPDRTLKHIALLLTPVDILRNQLTFPFDTIQLCDKIIKDASDKVEMLSDLKDVNIFWDAINYELIKEYPRIIKGKHYLREDSELILYFKVKECFPIYSEYCKSTKGQYSWIDQHTLYSLLTADNYAYSPSSQKNRGKKIYKSKFGNCIKLKFEMADDEKIVIMGKEIYIKS